MKNLFLVSFAVAVFHFSGDSVFACSCPTVGPDGFYEGKLKYSNAVFSGEVQNITSKAGVLEITFQVFEFWKGRLTSEFIVSTDGKSSCRYNFQVGKKY